MNLNLLFSHLLFSFLFFQNCVTNTPDPAFCLGNGERKAIYLHGVVGDQGEPESYRAILRKFSEEAKLRLATPRAYKPCAANAPADRYCWHWGPENLELLKSRLHDAQKQSQACFSTSEPVHLYIGFSNGAGFLNRLYQDCVFKKEDTIIAIGNGLGSYAKANYKGDLKECGKLVLIIGKKDAANREQVQFAYDTLKARSANVSLVEYEGGHELNESIILPAFGNN